LAVQAGRGGTLPKAIFPNRATGGRCLRLGTRERGREKRENRRERG
jgi:hypothetical protein